MKKACLFCVFFTFFFSACTLIPLPSANPTPLPSTFTPTAGKTSLQSTITPAASKTPLPPTSTPTARPIRLGQRQVVSEGGFSFQLPFGYSTQIDKGNVFATDPSGLIFITLMGRMPNTYGLKEETAADNILVTLFSNLDGEYEKGNLKAFTINGIQGISYDISGSFSGKPWQGEAVVVKPENDIAFFSLGVIFTDGDEER